MSVSLSEQAFEMSDEFASNRSASEKLYVFHTVPCPGETLAFAKIIKLALKSASTTGRVAVVCTENIWMQMQRFLSPEDWARLHYIDGLMFEDFPDRFWSECAAVDCVASKLHHFIRECDKQAFRSTFKESRCKFFLHGRDAALPFRFILSPDSKLCPAEVDALFADAHRFGISHVHVSADLPQIPPPEQRKEAEERRHRIGNQLWQERLERISLFDREILGLEK